MGPKQFSRLLNVHSILSVLMIDETQFLNNSIC